MAKRVCEELRAREGHPLRGWNGQVVRRTRAGGYQTLVVENGRPGRREESERSAADVPEATGTPPP